MITLWAPDGVGEVRRGDDLAALGGAHLHDWDAVANDLHLLTGVHSAYDL